MLELVLEGILEASWNDLGKVLGGQDASQDAPRRRQDGPRRRQDAPKTVKDGSRMSSRRVKMPLKPQTMQKCWSLQKIMKQTRNFMIFGRAGRINRAQHGTRTPQDGAKTHEDGARTLAGCLRMLSKMPVRRAQMLPRPLKMQTCCKLHKK